MLESCRSHMGHPICIELLGGETGHCVCPPRTCPFGLFLSRGQPDLRRQGRRKQILAAICFKDPNDIFHYHQNQQTDGNSGSAVSQIGHLPERASEISTGERNEKAPVARTLRNWGKTRHYSRNTQPPSNSQHVSNSLGSNCLRNRLGTKAVFCK